MTREGWAARYPDLAGKVALVTGDGSSIVDVVDALASNGAPICVVAADRATVDAAIAAAEATGVMGIVSAPEQPATWGRVLPHAEQRLGPLDVIVAIGSTSARSAVISAALPDMASRRRGVVIEVGSEPAELRPEVRHRYIVVDKTSAASDIAACVALCASDVLSAPTLTVHLTG